MSTKKVNSNSQLHTFECQNIVLQVTGNNNQIVLEDCNYQTLVTGNDNKIIILQNGNKILGTKLKNTLNIIGNGNYVSCGGKNLTLIIKGNGNQVQGETDGLLVAQNDGFGNIVPECAIIKKVEKPIIQQNKIQKNTFGLLSPRHRTFSSFNNQQLNPDFINNQINQKTTHNFGNFGENTNNRFYDSLKYINGQNMNNKYKPFQKKYKQQKSQKEQESRQQEKKIFHPYSYGYNKYNEQFSFGKGLYGGGLYGPNNQLVNQTIFQKNRQNKTNSSSAKNLNHINPRLNQHNQSPNLKPHPKHQPVTNKYDDQEPIPLSQQQLGRLQKSKHIGKSINCNICLQDITSQHQEIYLFCFHSYHSKCILGWFRKSSRCPFCFCCVRKQIKESSKYN